MAISGTFLMQSCKINTIGEQLRENSNVRPMFASTSRVYDPNWDGNPDGGWCIEGQSCSADVPVSNMNSNIVSDYFEFKSGMGTTGNINNVLQDSENAFVQTYFTADVIQNILNGDYTLDSRTSSSGNVNLLLVRDLNSSLDNNVIFTIPVLE